MKKAISGVALGAMVIAATAASPAFAKKAEAVQLAKCETSLGTIAVVEGETQGWSEYGLGSPRALVNSLAIESGCFTPYNPASGEPADFLMNIIAGDSEEIDQSIEMAKSAAMQGLVSSGAAGSLLSSVPGAGQLLGMFGGLGGKKKRLAAGIKLISPSNGMTIAAGQGVVKKSTLSFGGAGAWDTGAQEAGYGSSKDGKMLVEAFVLAFNQLAGQEATIASVPKMARSAPDEPEIATVAAVTSMLASPASDAGKVRELMVGTTLTPTGRREGLFIEVTDNFGTEGWVSVEALN